MLQNVIPIKRGSITSCLRLPSASWMSPRFWVLEGAGNWFVSTKGWQRQRFCMLRKGCFFGWEKDVRSLLCCFWGHWRDADKATQASMLDRGRCIYLWYSVAPRRAPPCPTLIQPPTNLKSIASGSKPSFFQRHSNDTLTSRASTFRTFPCRYHNASDAVNTKVSRTTKSGRSEVLLFKLLTSFPADFLLCSTNAHSAIIPLCFSGKPYTFKREVFVNAWRILMSPVWCWL